MDGVTDAAFRYIAAKYGKPDVVITEFTAAEGIRAGALRLLDDFMFNPIERPVVAQLFGADPDAFIPAAAVASALGFDGIDINMGCPAKNITERGAGAALIGDPERAKQIVRATRRGNRAWVDGASLIELGLPEELAAEVMKRREVLGIVGRVELPISIKTRIGIQDVVVEEWIKHLLEVEPVAITIHGRTLKQLYSGLSDWEAIARAAIIIHQTPTIVLGNGDVASRQDALDKVALYSVDGALIGRAAFGNPWVFQGHEATIEERLAVALEHAQYFHTLFGDKGFVRMRKHLLDYVRGFDGAKELRMQLMKVSSLADVEAIL